MVTNHLLTGMILQVHPRKSPKSHVCWEFGGGSLKFEIYMVDISRDNWFVYVQIYIYIITLEVKDH